MADLPSTLPPPALSQSSARVVFADRPDYELYFWFGGCGLPRRHDTVRLRGESWTVTEVVWEIEEDGRHAGSSILLAPLADTA